MLQLLAGECKMCVNPLKLINKKKSEQN